MSDVLPPTAEGPAPRAPPTAAHRLDFEFHATGSEYFWIWIVNLPLTIASLGIYSPGPRSASFAISTAAHGSPTRPSSTTDAPSRS